MNILKILAISAVISAVVAFGVGSWLVSNQPEPIDQFGASGITRFPNSGIAAKWLKIIGSPSTATSGEDGLFQAGTSSISHQLKLDRVNFGGLLSVSGTSAVNTTSSITAANICDNGILEWAPTAGTGMSNASATLPAGDALQSDCLQSVGDWREVVFRNTAATSTVIFIEGASTSLRFASSTASTTPFGKGNGGNQTSVLLRFILTSAATKFVEIQATMFR